MYVTASEKYSAENCYAPCLVLRLCASLLAMFVQARLELVWIRYINGSLP